MANEKSAVTKAPPKADSSRLSRLLPVQRSFFQYKPALIGSLKGYSSADLRRDFLAGVIVGIVALPLSIALAIAVGATPQSGLYTAIIGGGMIAALGGSRTQVSGPTAAFIVILAPIYLQHGELGLMAAGLIAGVMLIVMGLIGLGSLIKYVPYPVTTGFTSGIAVTIGTIQLKDIFGLNCEYEHTKVLPPVEITHDGIKGIFVQQVPELLKGLPDHFHEKVLVLARAFTHTDSGIILHTGTIGMITLGVLILYPHFFPAAARRVPGPLVGVLISVLATLAAGHFLKWNDIQTIGTKFGGIPRGLPTFNAALFKDFKWSVENVTALTMPAIAIAMLGAIESLLSAVVSDGMAGTKHDSNTELIGQGIGNIFSPMFGGIAATGAIARTATNIRNGGRTPIASIVHALTLLAIMLIAAPLASYIPMAALGAILLVVAYNMAELKHFHHLLRAPRSDTAVLLICFFLTVFTDMVISVIVGMLLAALLFMRRMSNITSVNPLDSVAADAEMQSHELEQHDIPKGVTIYSVDGPFFFGASEKAITAMEAVDHTTKIVVLRLNRVPVVDATGLYALEKVHEHLMKHKIRLVLSGTLTQPRQAMDKSGFLKKVGSENVTSDIEWALVRCYELLGPGAKQKSVTDSQLMLKK